MFASLSLPAEAGEKSASEGLYRMSCHLEKDAICAGKCASATSGVEEGTCPMDGTDEACHPFYPNIAPLMAGT